MSGFEPLYGTVRDALAGDILSGKVPVGKRLPSEPALCRIHGVSRVTLRRALDELEADGLIARVQGSGTFVASNKARRKFEKIWKVIIPRYQLYLRFFLDVESFAHDHGYEVIFASDTTASFPDQIRRSGCGEIAGYLATPRLEGGLNERENKQTLRAMMKLRQERTPLVLINRRPTKYAFDSVSSDDYAVGQMGTRHLIDHGCRRIAYLSSPRHFQDAERQRGYREAMAAASLRACVWAWDAGKDMHALIKEWLSARRAEAVFAFSDDLAVHVQWVAHGMGIRIPEDLAIVGEDNLGEDMACPFPITSVDPDMPRMGRLACELLLRRASGDWSDFPQKLSVEPRLVTRGSCGCRVRKDAPAEKKPFPAQSAKAGGR